jgi:hypothetical protein
MTHNYKQLQRHLWSPEIISHSSNRQAFPACCLFTNRFVATTANSGNSSASRVQVLSTELLVQTFLSTVLIAPDVLFISSLHEPYKMPFSYCCLSIRCSGNVFNEPLPRNGHCSLSFYRGRYITKAVRATLLIITVKFTCFNWYRLNIRNITRKSLGPHLCMGKNSGSAAIVGNLQLMGKSVSDKCNCMSYKQNDFE